MSKHNEMADTWEKGWQGLGSSWQGVRVRKGDSFTPKAIRVQLFVPELSTFVNQDMSVVDAVRYLYLGGHAQNVSLIWEDNSVSYANVWYHHRGEHRYNGRDWAWTERPTISINSLGGHSYVEQGISPDDDTDEWYQISSLGYEVTHWAEHGCQIDSGRGAFQGFYTR